MLLSGRRDVISRFLAQVEASSLSCFFSFGPDPIFYLHTTFIKSVVPIKAWGQYCRSPKSNARSCWDLGVKSKLEIRVDGGRRAEKRSIQCYGRSSACAVTYRAKGCTLGIAWKMTTALGSILVPRCPVFQHLYHATYVFGGNFEYGAWVKPHRCPVTLLLMNVSDGGHCSAWWGLLWLHFIS